MAPSPSFQEGVLLGDSALKFSRLVRKSTSQSVSSPPLASWFSSRQKCTSWRQKRLGYVADTAPQQVEFARTL
jgi:hypothetical protein